MKQSIKAKIKKITDQWLLVIVYKRWRNRIKVKSAIKQANRMHKMTKKQFYVLQIFGKIRVYDRVRINLLVDRKVLSKQMKSAIYLQKVAIYFTK
jgi:hypothetical protein